MEEMPFGKYIDPFTDFGFKRIFGSETNKDILIDFLNELFAGERRVVDLSYAKNESDGQLAVYRKAIFDLSCTGVDGEQFIIEVQRVKQEFFRDRCLYYAASLIREQAEVGASKWKYDLKPVYLIGLMDFCFEESLPDSYLHRIHLTRKDSGEIFYEKFGMIFIEMPRFNKSALEVKTELDKWFYLMKNLGNLDQVPAFLRKPVFEKMLTVAEVCNLNQQEKMAYDASLKAKWDYYNSLDYAIKEGVEKGMKEGMEAGMKEGMEAGMKEGMEAGMKEGMKEGLEAGIREGIEEGKQKEKMEVARNMKSKGFDIAVIADLLGLTDEEIRNA